LEEVRLTWSGPVLLALVVGGVFSTAIAFTVQSWAQQYTTPTRTALIFSLEPVFAWVTAFATAGELLSGRATAGALLILAGIVLVEMKPGRGEVHPC
jgi:drug/metabolite transporter (DMT)-like permease